MRKFKFAAAMISVIAGLCFSIGALAMDGPAPLYLNSRGGAEVARAVILIDPDGNFYKAEGGAGGGASDASAANQILHNTKLDLLHTDIATTLVGFLDGLESGLSAIGADVDSLETLIGTTNSSLTTIDGRVDGLEALIGTTNSTLTTQNGFLDGLETLVGTTNTTLTTIDGRVDGLEGFTDGIEGSLTTIDGRVDGLESQIGIVTETAPASDTASSGLNGRLQKVAQHQTATDLLLDGLEGLIGTTNTTLTTIDGRVDGLEGFTDGLEALIGTTNTTLDNIDTHIGIKTEVAPASDTASSGLNGRAQRIAQNLTTLTGKLPVALGSGGGLKIDGSGTALPVSGTVTANATLAAETTKVIGTVNVAAAQTIATTNAGTFAVQAAQSGTWTVQPGNTANTTAWKVDGSAVTQPVSIATAPVLVAGSAIIGKVGIDQTTDGTTNKVEIGTATTVAISADAIATSQIGLNARAFQYKFNGTTWDRDFICTNTAAVTVAANTTVQIVALAAAKTIYVCSFVITTSNTTSSTGNIFKTGTGTLCATGIASLTGSMHMGPIGHIELSAPDGSILFKSASASALCLTNGTNGVDGFLTYAQF